MFMEIGEDGNKGDLTVPKMTFAGRLHPQTATIPCCNYYRVEAS